MGLVALLVALSKDAQRLSASTLRGRATKVMMDFNIHRSLFLTVMQSPFLCGARPLAAAQATWGL